MSYFGTTDFPLEVAKGKINGHEPVSILGRTEDLVITDTRPVWNLAQDLTYLPADTQLYASSTSVSDTTVVLAVQGIDDTYAPVTRTVTLNGQNQVALSGLMFRVFAAVTTGSTSPQGDVYIAETDTLTLGVPNTPSKIKSKMCLTGIDSSSADWRSYNSTHNGFYTVPAGKTFFGVSGTFNIEKDMATVNFGGRIKLFGSDVWLNRVPTPLYQSSGQLPFATRTLLPEKSEIQFRASSDNPDVILQFQIQGWLVDNSALDASFLSSIDEFMVS